MKKLTKILVIILSVALVCTGLVMVISADSGNVASIGKTEYATLEEAIEALPNTGGTVKLIADASLSSICSIVKDTTIDLNGYTLNADGTFSVEKSINFTIEGYGKIVANSSFIESITTNTSPVITIKGTKALIEITKPAGSTPAFVQNSVGTYNFVNVNMVSEVMDASGIFVMRDDSLESASFNIKASELVATGTTVSQQCFIRMGGNGKLNVDTSKIQSDGTTINTAGTKAVSADYIVVTNSYIKALQTKVGTNDPHSSAFGAYSQLYGTIKIVDSVVESSYRPFIFSCEANTIETYPNMKIDLVNTKLYMNGFRSDVIVRNVPLNIDGESLIIVSDKMSQPYHDGNVAHCRITVQPGMRTNYLPLTQFAGNQSLSFPDGSTVDTSDTYKFIYDPIGNSDAPYKVVALKDAEGNAISPVPSDTVAAPGAEDYFYITNGSQGHTSSATGTTAVTGGSNTTNILWSDMYVQNTMWWHPMGSYSHVVTSDVNSYFAYHTDESTTSNDTAVEISFGQPLTADTPVSPSNYGLVIYEIDIATDTGSFASLVLSLNSRNDPIGGGDTRANTNVNLEPDGTLKEVNGQFKFVNPETPCKLSTEGWNRITIAVDTSTTKGTSYLYVNGTLIATSTASYNTGAYLFGIRLSIYAKQEAGRALLVDNANTRAYKTKADTVDLTNYATIDYAIPKNDFALTSSNVFVGPIEYPTIDEAITAAAALGTYPSVKTDIQGLTVTQDIIIFTNGHTIEISDESLKAAPILAKDGTIIAYDFKAAYGDMTAKYYWFCGDLNNPDHFLHPENPDYFKKTELGIGDIPTPPSEIVIDSIIDIDTYSEKYHSGWDYDGDGENAVQLLPLSMQDMNKEVYLYPAYAYNYFTAVVYNSNGVIEYVMGDESVTSLFSTLKANSGATLKLLSDFKLDSAPAVEFTSGSYNIDFNGNTLYMTSKGTVLTACDGAQLNIYSSAPGGMFYAVELNEADGTVYTGAGTFAKINDTSLASKINIGDVTVDGTAYDGANLTLAGDCIAEAASGIAGSEVNIAGAAVIRVAYDTAADAVIHADGFGGAINVNDASFILPTGSAVISNSGTAACDATFKNCAFIFNGNSDGTNKDIVKNSTGFNKLKFEGCITNGKMSSTDAASDIIGSGNAAYVLDFADGYEFADGAELVKYNAPVKAPTLTAPDFYDEGAGATGAYIAQLEGGVIRIQRWAFSIAENGAVTNGYFYIYPNGYEGKRYDTVNDTSVTLPSLTHIVTTETVNITYKNSAGEVIATDVYALGGNLISTDGVSLPAAEEYVALKVVNNGTWNVTLPIIGLTEDVVLTPAGTRTEVKIENVKVSVSLYKDFAINVYIPEAYGEYITAITNGEEEMIRENAVLDGANYIKVTVKMPSYAASRDANIKLSVTEGSLSADGLINISVADYAAKIIEDAAGAETDDVKLVRYMAAYGYEAAKYFKTQEDSELSALCADTYDYSAYVNEPDLSELSAVLSSVTVDLDADLAVVLTVKDGFAGKITILGNDYNITKDGERDIVIKGLRIADFASALPIAAYDEAGVELINSSYALLDAFTSYHIANAKADNDISVKAYSLVKAFYNYVQFASNYASANE